MLEQIQTIVRHTLAFQAAAEAYASQERGLVSQDPEHLFAARIVCADGFSVPVAVNKDHFPNLPIPGHVGILHDRFHQAAGYGKCEGPMYNLIT